jgi:hypothetical protein
LLYDAYWLRQASDVTRPRGPRNNHRTRDSVSHYPLVGFTRLQGLDTHRHRLGTGASLGFFPFSAIITRRDNQDSTPDCSPSTGFLNLSTGQRPQRLASLFHPAGTPRVWAFRVSHRTVCRSFTTCPLPRRYLPYMASFQDSPAAPDRETREALPPSDHGHHLDPHRLATIGFHLGLRPASEQQPDSTRLLRHTVSPAPRDSTSLGLLSFRVSLSDDPGVERLPFLGFEPLQGFSVIEDGLPREAESLPSWNFCLLTCTSS